MLGHMMCGVNDQVAIDNTIDSCNVCLELSVVFSVIFAENKHYNTPDIRLNIIYRIGKFVKNVIKLIAIFAVDFLGITESIVWIQ